MDIGDMDEHIGTLRDVLLTERPTEPMTDAAIDAMSELESTTDPRVWARMRELLREAVERRDCFIRELVGQALVMSAQLEGLADVLRSMVPNLGDDMDGLTAAVATVLEKHRGAALPAVRGLLEDSDEGARDVGLWALGFIGEPSTVPLLMAALKDRSPGIRSTAVGALGSFVKDPAVFAALVATAEEDADPHVRISCSSALGSSKNHAATPVLLKILTTDLDLTVRRWGAIGLGYLGDPEAESALREAAKAADHELRENAKRALGRIEKAKG